MSIPRFLVESLPADGIVSLPPDEANHAVSVLRLRVGAQVVLFDGEGGEAHASITDASKKKVVAKVVKRTDTNRELSLDVRMFVSLPKGDRQKALVDFLTQQGVAKLTPLISQRGVAQPTPNTLKRLRRMVVESSKQSGRNRLMQIEEPEELDSLLRQVQVGENAYFAHPYGSSESLPTTFEDLSSVNVVVGPEGGLADEEVESLRLAGWKQISLGPRILRIETAAATLAAILAQSAVH